MGKPAGEATDRNKCTLQVVLMLALGATSCAGPDDSPSAPPGSATSSPRTLTPSQRTKLELRQVIEIIASSSPDWQKTPVTCELQDGALRECLVSTLDLSRVVLVAGPPLGGAKYVLGPVIVDAADVARVEATYEAQFDVGWSVDVHLTPEGAKAFYRATLAAVGATSPQDQIAVIVDGEIVSSPHVVQPIRSGNLAITGGFSEEEAKALASSVPPFN
jgi:preprotein translocase subunit SecD